MLQDVTEETAEAFLEDKVGKGLVHPSVASVKLPELPHMIFPGQVRLPLAPAGGKDWQAQS